MIILDIEASGLDPKSYPIEVAWCELQGNKIYSRLINPETAGDWTFWDDYAEEAYHHISRSTLVDEGENVVVVARELAEALSDEMVFSDAPEQDGLWLAKLFDAVGQPNPVRLMSLREIYCKEYEYQIDLGLKQLDRPHRALDDCIALAELVNTVVKSR